MVVGTLSGEHFERSVLLAQHLEEITHFLLAEGIRKIVLFIIDEIRGDVGIKVVQGTDANSFEHHADIIFRMREICKIAHIYFATSA